MNLTSFLKQTDTLTAKYSTEQLIAFIHDIARTIPENCREDFLERLRMAGGDVQTLSYENAVKDLDFDGMYKYIKNNLNRIDSQELMLTGILNEEYNDWYDYYDDGFYYEDNDGISDMLAKACDFVHTCMDIERYLEGFEIGKQMFSMKILCDSEYCDEEFSIGDMVQHELLQCDLKQVILDTAYCAYHAAVSLEKRPEVLYGVIKDAGKDEITLEAIMQHGEELPNFEDFLPNWIEYLGNIAEKVADNLIWEAIALLNDRTLAVQYAEKFVALHPQLYLNILKNREYATANDMISIGIKAMKDIPKKYIMRSKVALETAEYVIAANGEQSLLEECYFAAYESDTTALSYLRAMLNGYDSEEKRKELRKVFMKFHADVDNRSFITHNYNYSYEYSHFEPEENKPDSFMVLVLRFLDGQFEYVLDKGLNQSKALGWTGTFMKQGIALYLLYLHEGSRSGRGIAAMADMVKKK